MKEALAQVYEAMEGSEAPSLPRLRLAQGNWRSRPNLGRPRLVDDKDIATMRRWRRAGTRSVNQMAKHFGIKPSTVYAYTSKKKT